MKNLIQTLLSLGAFGAAALVAQAQPAPKIVVVDMAKLFAGHYETKAKEVELADARAKAKAQIDEMNKDGDALVAQYKALDEESKNPTSAPDAKAKALADAQKKGQEIQAKMQDVQTFANNANQMIQQRVQAFRSVVTEEISKIVVTIGKRHDATLILDKSGPSAFGFPIVISADPGYDITDEVAAEIAKNAPPPSATPAPAAPAMGMPSTPPPASDAPQITVPGVTPSK
jgi:outer membrane protein